MRTLSIRPFSISPEATYVSGTLRLNIFSFNFLKSPAKTDPIIQNQVCRALLKRLSTKYAT